MKNVLTILFSILLIFVCISDTTAKNIDKSDREDIHSMFELASAIVDTTIELNLTICSGDMIVINGSIYDEINPSGTEILIGSTGCDSTIIINLEIIETPNTLVNLVVCPGDTYFINGTAYDETNPSGTEILVGASVNGCDSIVSINLIFLQSPTTYFSEYFCVGDSVFINGNVYDATNPSGTIIIANGSANGCDSIIEVDLSFVDPNFTVYGLDMIANFSDADSYQWMLDGSPIPGATNNTWSAEANGNYALQVESNGVTCLSDNVSIILNAVHDISQDPRIKIYPNPIQDQIFIDLSNTLQGKIIRYELFNLQGQLVQKGIYQDKINLEATESGIFIFRLIDVDQNIYIQKLKT